MATKVNLYIDQGSDFTTTLGIKDDEGNNMDLSAYTGKASIRKAYESLIAVDFTCVLNNGSVTLSLSANASANMEYGRYVYDILIWPLSNVKTRLFEGLIILNPRVTAR